jgi:hypothetical protein
MGEAKRRKLKDPNFGKSERKPRNKKPSDPFFLLPQEEQQKKAIAWDQQARASLNPNFKPDYGHWHLLTFGCNPIKMFLAPPYMVFPDRLGKMLTASSNKHCISILMDKDQYKENVEGKEGSPLSMELQIMPKHRYKTPQTNEFVIPFLALRFLE